MTKTVTALTEPQRRLLAEITAGHVTGGYNEPCYISEYCQSPGGWDYFLGRKLVTVRVTRLIDMGLAKRDEYTRAFNRWPVKEPLLVRECRVVPA